MWLFYSFGYALVIGLQNAYFKEKSIQINPIILAWGVLAVSSLLFSPLFLFGIPHLNQAFWISIIFRLLLDSLAFTLYIKAIQISPLSLMIPMLSLQLVFMIATQFYINHLFPTPIGIVGVFITVIGVYMLHFDHETKHIFSPFQAILKEKGIMLTLFVAILWSIVIPLQKLAIDNSTPYFYTAFFQLIWTIFFAPIAYFADKKNFKRLFSKKMILRVFPVGALDAIQVFCMFMGFSLTIPVYVNAIGSTSILFSSFFGAVFFKEKLKSHLIPTIIILLGTLCIILTQK